MKLGLFSLSLSVKDLQASKAFYEKLGFEQFGGQADQGWLIMKNPSCVIGLFEGMFDKNMLTFNPGWNDKAERLDTFEDVRDIQKRLKAAGIPLETEVDETSSGPGHFIVHDPDGNPVMVDQHV